jgi:predicted DNA-binding transcriptional regulator AlpA
MIRKVLRRPAVLSATGWSEKTLERKVRDKVFPSSHRLGIDPDSRTVVWFEDEVEAWQRGTWMPSK